MRPNHTCESCIRKKRKCDRLKPSCTLCKLANIECHYKTHTRTSASSLHRQAGQEDSSVLLLPQGSGREKPHPSLSLSLTLLQQQQQEALLHQLQQSSMSMRVDMNAAANKLSSAKFGQTTAMQDCIPTPPSETIPRMLIPSSDTTTTTTIGTTATATTTIGTTATAATATATDSPMISETFFTHIRPHLLFVSEPFLRKYLPSSPFASYSVNAMCILSTSPIQSTELVQSLRSAAISHLGQAVSHPSPVSVIGMMLLALCTGKVSAPREVSHYLSMTVRLARDISLGSEEGIHALATCEEEKNDLRGIWWSVYQLCHFMECSTGMRSEIKDDDCRLFLPTNNNLSTAISHDLDGELDIALMSLPGWHMPAIANRGLVANMLIIQRILCKASRFSQLSRTNELSGVARVQAHMQLEATLTSWYDVAPPSVKHAADLFVAQAPEYTVEGWRPAFVLGLYHLARIQLWRNAFAQCIQQSSTLALSSRAVSESIHAAQSIASGLAIPMIKHSASRCITPFIVNGLFAAAVCLVTALKLPFRIEETTQMAASLGAIIEGMQILGVVWNFGLFELDVVEQLMAFTSASAVASMMGDLQFPKILRQVGHAKLRAMAIPEFSRCGLVLCNTNNNTNMAFESNSSFTAGSSPDNADASHMSAASTISNGGGSSTVTTATTPSATSSTVTPTTTSMLDSTSDLLKSHMQTSQKSPLEEGFQQQLQQQQQQQLQQQQQPHEQHHLLQSYEQSPDMMDFFQLDAQIYTPSASCGILLEELFSFP
ncbi:hypothetical protein BASA50_003582 [Batrachochytrium salamandrivorans]|uniref:Zn(2)-C6 fungal-type domain-containing protein n=1 Tax=Batrachochytrium salamandrivorans TaxID=1357716 RepID=A0ABQ8FHV3_9FUNG|nr:hypothetical protein BASA62_009910 [Batrachochytrium salamandrivorans]KAH6569839.1 hypothetical protein BASA60_008035 [Batrachochytrium salamandrivorans]KAH6598543.1 hypothetical protein BASA50_003582 [Batrachochytrium salamandrivorans]KAH6602090.1 hypothetical protein BASA61_001459 [Batrachochytrium salamandrivorans]KAH9266590.1 hypothetical protein BASA84_001078 [Batrachochytrium salamandrivorans]